MILRMADGGIDATFVAAFVSAVSSLGALAVSVVSYRSSVRSPRFSTTNVKDGLRVNVTNVGGQALTVIEIGICYVYRPSLWGLHRPLTLSEHDFALPRQLAPGETARWTLPWEYLASKVADFGRGKWRPLFGIAIYMDTGEQTKVFPLHNIHARRRRWLLDLIRDELARE